MIRSYIISLCLEDKFDFHTIIFTLSEADVSDIFCIIFLSPDFAEPQYHC